MAPFSSGDWPTFRAAGSLKASPSFILRKSTLFAELLKRLETEFEVATIETVRDEKVIAARNELRRKLERKFEELGSLMERVQRLSEAERAYRAQIEKFESGVSALEFKADRSAQETSQMEALRNSAARLSTTMTAKETERTKLEADVLTRQDEIAGLKLQLETATLKASAALSQRAHDVYEVLADLNRSLNEDFRSTQLDAGPQSWTDEVRLAKIRSYWNDKGANGIDRQVQVYREIYQNLVDGQIVLSRVGARPGDIVTIELLVYPPGSTNPVGFTLAKISVEAFGLRSEIADSFLLVKKLGKDQSSTTSPSNFKGAAGVSLLWSRYKRPEEGSTWLDRNLSWGLNVSYLDFDTSKDIEVGAGPVIGLFRDRVHLGVGANLNVSGGLKQRSYAFLGFSFAKIADQFKKDKSDVRTQK